MQFYFLKILLTLLEFYFCLTFEQYILNCTLVSIMSKNLRSLSGRKGMEENLFEHLSALEAKEGAFDPTEVQSLADKYLVGTSTVHGAASFYDFLNPAKSGKKVFSCSGSACQLSGKQAEVDNKLGKHFEKSEIGEVYCLGRCHETAAFHLNGHNYSGVAIDHLEQLLSGEKSVLPDTYPAIALGAGWLTSAEEGPEHYLDALKVAVQSDRNQLLEEVHRSGIRGRGGAGFPLGIKLAAVLKEKADRKYIVCNADEGDPGAFSDRYLLEEKPYLVLFGMAYAGILTGATEGVLYIRAEYPEAIEICKKAALVVNALFPLPSSTGEQVDFKIYVVKAQGAYICGEETALLSSLEGLRPEVRTRPPFPVQYGLFGKPTAVNNVETLANLYPIFKRGGAAFKGVGTERSSGTKLLSLDSHFNRPGLYEVDMGTPLQTVIEELGGGMKQPVKAYHIGGPLGGLVPAFKTTELTIDFESFASNSFLLGHASILSIPASYPLIRYLEHLFAFTAHESCGKCFPCRIGSTRGKELLQKAQDNQLKIDRELWTDLLETLEKGSLCALGGGLPLPVKNALSYFPEELNAYFK